jgi:hypothetical protein
MSELKRVYLHRYDQYIEDVESPSKLFVLNTSHVKATWIVKGQYI